MDKDTCQSTVNLSEKRVCRFLAQEKGREPKSVEEEGDEHEDGLGKGGKGRPGGGGGNKNGPQQNKGERERGQGYSIRWSLQKKYAGMRTMESKATGYVL